MVNLLPSWLTKSKDAFRRLADQPVVLFLLLLALNALARPYAGTTHDARLYSVQALNQAEGGAFADDIFLRYGSQDQYSLFSRLVGPAVALAGVRTAFFVLYLIFNTYFVWAMFRLVRTLIADPYVSTSALIFLVAADLYYGGHSIFTVHEQFFTPRLIASAFTLHALACVVEHRFVSSLALLAFGMLFHPLMTFGGLLIWGFYLARLLLSNRLFYAGLIAASIAGIAFLASPLALRVFGEMDATWHEMVRLAVTYNYPDAWAYVDWLNNLVALGLCGLGAFWLFRDDAIRSRFLFVALLVALIGVVTTTIASLSPYALLFQGQPYRALWILKILQIPLGFLVFVRLCESATTWSRVAAIGLATFFLVFNFGVNEIVVYLFAAPLAVFYFRKIEEPTKPDWWFRAALATLVLGAAGWMLYRWSFLYTQRATMLTYFDLADMARVVAQCVPGVFWIVLVLVALHFVNQTRTLAWTCLVVALALPTIHFGLDANVTTRAHLTRFGGDIEFARQEIEARGQRRVPSVYCSLGRVDWVWIDLHATSYYDPVQTAGVMFRRDTALELRRRVGYVRAFEMARLRTEELFLPSDAKNTLETLLELKFDGAGPVAADLVKLCQEPSLDFVVIPHEFPGLYSATNGRVYVYECSKIRTAVGHVSNVPLAVAAR